MRTRNMLFFVAMMLAGAFSIAHGQTVCYVDDNASPGGDGTITNCFWDFGDSGLGNTNVDVSAVVTHLYASVGSYTVTLNVTNDQGAAGTTNQVINIETVPQQPALTGSQGSSTQSAAAIPSAWTSGADRKRSEPRWRPPFPAQPERPAAFRA